MSNSGDHHARVLLTAADLAARWSITVGYLANLRYEGRGPAFVKLGNRVRYRIDEVERIEREGMAVAA